MTKDQHTGLSEAQARRSLSVQEEAREYHEALLRPLFEGRKFILAGGLAVSLGKKARALAALGAAPPFLLAFGEGTGKQPGPEAAHLHLFDIRPRDLVDQLLQEEATLRDLPRDVRATIDRWDPDGSARVLCSPGDVPVVAGRETYAGRKPAWMALEDKTTIDAFWDAAGVQRAPSRIVPAEHRELIAAATALDQGLGTVWVADVKSGIHGSAIGLRWVRPGDDGIAAADSLRGIADRVRVMPFLEGIPVSMHGIVFDDAVAVFRPVEMVVLRPEGSDRLLYAGCSNWFDPGPQDRDAMRRTARRVGQALRERVDYRGAFTVDGILSTDGFMPTELNPRTGAGFSTLVAGLGDFPFEPLCWAVAEGEHLAFRPTLLERAVLDSAERHRAGGGSITTRTTLDAVTVDLVRDGTEYREARGDEVPVATLVASHSPIGGFLSFSLDENRNQPDTSTAPEMCRALRYADRNLGTEFGRLTAARNVRS
ncbi:MAG: hypothetical protein OXT64_06130 [Gammaproteobacteria bacterium]|nr:hypothetical protein [Gammaproteobacteria bacterium]